MKPAQERVVEVGVFYQRDVGVPAENLFDYRQYHRGEYARQAAGNDGEQRLPPRDAYRNPAGGAYHEGEERKEHSVYDAAEYHAGTAACPVAEIDCHKRRRKKQHEYHDAFADHHRGQSRYENRHYEPRVRAEQQNLYDWPEHDRRPVCENLQEGRVCVEVFGVAQVDYEPLHREV